MRFRAKPLLLVAVTTLAAAATTTGQAQSNVQPRANNYGPQALFGTWGTAEQCAAHKAGNNTDLRLFPYVISNDWIQHGMVYCYLGWREQFTNASGAQAHAVAQCGEDSLRDYQVFLDLRDGSLRIRWSEDFTTRELQACGSNARGK